jgi:hypothetical protein
MPPENDANLENYSELRAHVNLSKKILEAEKPDTDEVQQKMNDLSMYYERIVQLKTMRIQTLQELNDETETAHKATAKIASANKRAFKWLLRASFGRTVASNKTCTAYRTDTFSRQQPYARECTHSPSVGAGEDPCKT